MEVPLHHIITTHHLSSPLYPLKLSMFSRPTRPFKAHRSPTGLLMGTPESLRQLKPRWPTNHAILHRAQTRALASKARQESEADGGLPNSIFERDGELEESELNADEWTELGCKREKWTRGRGLVEVLECLEEEAIMGNDEGREPNDYNRRARIFDKSSRVFQALKERNNES